MGYTAQSSQTECSIVFLFVRFVIIFLVYTSQLNFEPTSFASGGGGGGGGGSCLVQSSIIA